MTLAYCGFAVPIRQNQGSSGSSENASRFYEPDLGTAAWEPVPFFFPTQSRRVYSVARSTEVLHTYRN